MPLLGTGLGGLGLGVGAQPVTVSYVGRVDQKVVRWRFDTAFAENLNASAFVNLKVNDESPDELISDADAGLTYVDLQYTSDTDIGDTWLVDGDVSIGGNRIVTGGQTGTVKGLITITSATDSDGTVAAVLNGAVIAGVAGQDGNIRAYDGLDWLPALALSDLDADTPSSGQTTLALEFL